MRSWPQRVVRRSAQEARNLASMLKELPYQIHDTMEQVRDGQIEVGFRHEGLEDLFMHLDKVTNRMVVALIAGTGVIGSALLGAFVESGPHILGVHVFSIVGFGLSMSMRSPRHLIRAGIHTGECERDGTKLAGIAVHIGARVAALAEPDEVLVSRTVKDLVAGSGIQFRDRGEHELKGIPGRWHLFGVEE